MCQAFILAYTENFTFVPGTHLIDLKSMKDVTNKEPTEVSNKETLDSKFVTDRWSDNPNKDNFTDVDEVHVHNENTKCLRYYYV